MLYFNAVPTRHRSYSTTAIVNKGRFSSARDPGSPPGYRRSSERPASGHLLGGQRFRIFRYLVVEVLDRLAALRRLRLHRCRLHAGYVDRLVVQRLHVDYANANCGAAEVVAGRVGRLVDGHHVAVNDLQSSRLRELEISRIYM